MPADLLLEQYYYDAIREGMDFADEMSGEVPMAELPEDVEQSLRRTARLQAKQLQDMTISSPEARSKVAELVNEWMAMAGDTRKVSDLQELLFPEFGAMRALRIARTETANLMNSSIAAKLGSNGWDKIRWMAALDACDECLELDGEIMDISDFMDNPVQHPNCRCYPEAYEGDEEAGEGDPDGLESDVGSDLEDDFGDDTE
jgi:hypothetical protein